MTEIALALGGGGIRGISHLGVIQELENSGFKIKSVAGTSIGGLIGSIYAAGLSTQEIIKLIHSIDQNTVFRRKPNDNPSLLGLTGIHNLLIHVLGEKEFTDLRIPFACTAVDIKTAQEIVLTKGKVIDAVMATIAVPGIFPPIDMGNVRLVDGAVLDPVPTALARWLSPYLPIVSVCLNSEQKEWEFDPRLQIPSVASIPIPLIEQISKLRISQAFTVFSNSMDIMSRMLAELRMEKEKPDVIIRPQVDHIQLIDKIPDPEAIVQLGIDAAKNEIDNIKKTGSIQNWFSRIMKDHNHPGTLLSEE